MRNYLMPAAAAVAMLSAQPAAAQETADIIRDSLYAGTLTEGISALTPLADAGDAEAGFGVGMLELVSSIEGLAQAFYRHGMEAPRTGPMGPVLGLPVPENTNPETLDYPMFRTILADFVDGLDAARTRFAAAGEAGDYVVTIEPLMIRIDINGDGQSDDAETVAGVIGLAMGDPTLLAPPQDREPRPAGTPDPAGPAIGFDRADAIWLSGYANVAAAQADFFLAHDFSEFFDAAFHRLFPRAGLVMQAYATGGSLMMDPETDTAIADLIAAVHTINWPVTEPDRLRRVLTRFGEVTAASRANWAAITDETDDNNELLPSPSQTALDGTRPINTEVIDAWHETLDAVDAVLAGELLLPHWRFRQGFDLRAYFETAERTDLVMILTGLGALPYLKDGPIADADSFRAANRVFGSDFLGFAFWFN